MGSNLRRVGQQGRRSTQTRANGGFPGIRILFRPEGMGVQYVEGGRGNCRNAACRVDSTNLKLDVPISSPRCTAVVPLVEIRPALERALSGLDPALRCVSIPTGLTAAVLLG